MYPPKYFSLVHDYTHGLLNMFSEYNTYNSRNYRSLNHCQVNIHIHTLKTISKWEPCILSYITVYHNLMKTYVEKQCCCQERQPLAVSHLFIIHSISFTDFVKGVLAYSTSFLEVVMSWESAVDVSEDHLFTGTVLKCKNSW